MERLEHIILESFKKRAAQDVMWWEGSWLTGADLLDLVEKDRAVLEAAGFKEGQRLMTLLPNCPALEALALAVWSLKGTLIPMNMRAGVDNLLPTIDLVQPFAIIVGRGDDKAASGVRRYGLSIVHSLEFFTLGANLARNRPGRLALVQCRGNPGSVGERRRVALLDQ